MGVRVLRDKESGYQCLYCSCTMVAFGSIFYEDEDVDEFLNWLSKDARTYTDKELEGKVYEWRLSLETEKEISKIEHYENREGI